MPVVPVCLTRSAEGEGGRERLEEFRLAQRVGRGDKPFHVRARISNPVQNTNRI